MNFLICKNAQTILKKVDIVEIINKSLDLIKPTSRNSINFLNNSKNTFINGDEDQLNRVFINLLKFRRVIF